MIKSELDQFRQLKIHGRAQRKEKSGEWSKKS